MKKGRLFAAGVFCLLLVPSSSPGFPSKREEAIDRAIAHGMVWLRTIRVDPFAGGVSDFRLYAVEVEIWHRLWTLENDPEEQARLEDEVVSRLRQALDAQRLLRILEEPDGSSAFTEALVMASRCRTHGLDPTPITRALSSRIDRLRAEIDRVPPSLQALYSVYLDETGIELRLPLEPILSRGILSLRPREVDLTMAEVYYLTHEIYALTDYALRPLPSLAPEERTYLLRVLPFYTLFYGALNRLDVTAELITCLQAARMRETYAYLDGVRLLVERQNPDGSFGAPDPRVLGRPVEPADHLHPTMNCLTALLLDRRGP